jgi:hypothetical protein
MNCWDTGIYSVNPSFTIPSQFQIESRAHGSISASDEKMGMLNTSWMLSTNKYQLKVECLSASHPLSIIYCVAMLELFQRGVMHIGCHPASEFPDAIVYLLLPYSRMHSECTNNS